MTDFGDNENGETWVSWAHGYMRDLSAEIPLMEHLESVTSCQTFFDTPKLNMTGSLIWSRLVQQLKLQRFRALQTGIFQKASHNHTLINSHMSILIFYNEHTWDTKATLWKLISFYFWFFSIMGINKWMFCKFCSQFCRKGTVHCACPQLARHARCCLCVWRYLAKVRTCGQ